MKFQPIVPMIWTRELEATVSFYCEILGFHLGNYSEEWGWAAISKDECEIMIARPNESTPLNVLIFLAPFTSKRIMWKPFGTKSKTR